MIRLGDTPFWIDAQATGWWLVWIAEKPGRPVERAVAGETVEIPAVRPACTMSARVVRGGLLVTVHDADSAHPDDLIGGEDYRVCEFAVAPDSLASAAMWREWIGTERDDRTPAPPWCAVRVLPGLAGVPGAAVWLGDLERCVAWAWIG